MAERKCPFRPRNLDCITIPKSMLFGIFHLCPAEVSHQAFFLEGFHELLVLLRPIVVFIPLFEIFHVGVFVNAFDLPVNPAKTQRFFQRLAGLKRFRGFLFAEAVVLLGGLMFAAGFVVAGLDYRYQWSALPGWLVAAAAVVFVLGYLLYAEVLRENTYLSRTVAIQEGQKVVDTGLYAIIRHPMYLATVLMFIAMPLVLGSFYAFLVFLLYPAITVKRIRNEEEVLEKDLQGYAEYKKRVKYRLIPVVW